jgi:hypothetical protein
VGEGLEEMMWRKGEEWGVTIIYVSVFMMIDDSQVL